MDTHPYQQYSYPSLQENTGYGETCWVRILEEDSEYRIHHADKVHLGSRDLVVLDLGMTEIAL